MSTAACPNGHPVSQGDRFCQTCGSPVGEAPAAPAASDGSTAIPPPTPPPAPPVPPGDRSRRSGGLPWVIGGTLMVTAAVLLILSVVGDGDETPAASGSSAGPSSSATPGIESTTTSTTGAPAPPPTTSTSTTTTTIPGIPSPCTNDVYGFTIEYPDPAWLAVESEDPTAACTVLGPEGITGPEEASLVVRIDESFTYGSLVGGVIALDGTRPLAETAVNGVTAWSALTTTDDGEALITVLATEPVMTLATLTERRGAEGAGSDHALVHSTITFDGTGIRPIADPPPMPVAGPGVPVLRSDGIGDIRFGEKMNGAVERLAALIGAPDSDEVVYCPFRMRVVQWGPLKIYKPEADVEMESDVPKVFSGYTYFDIPFPDVSYKPLADTLGLTDPSALGYGAQLATLQAVYPDAAFTPGAEGWPDVPDAYHGGPLLVPAPPEERPDGLIEGMTFHMNGDGPKARVIRIMGGVTCEGG